MPPPAGQLEPRGFHAGEPAQDLEDFTQQEILVAENIAFPDPPFLHGEEMPNRHVIHIDQIHAGFNIRRHPALHKIDDDLAGRGRLHVTGADRCARIDDNHRKPLTRELQYFLFGKIF